MDHLIANPILSYISFTIFIEYLKVCENKCINFVVNKLIYLSIIYLLIYF